MKRHSSLVFNILSMVCMTALLIFIAITAVGTIMIYISTENSTKAEIDYAAHTLYNLYDSNYHGEYYIKDDAMYKGEIELTQRIFDDTTRSIGGSSEMDFTIFWNNTRMFTSIKNRDGSFAVGTSAADKVAENVLLGGLEYYYSSIDVNGQNYIGYYIPIMNSSAEAVGMIFAGKPARSALSAALKMIVYFMVISCVIMIISVMICSYYLNKIVSALGDIKNYMIKISDCDFSSELLRTTVERSDEVGDIAKSAEKLCFSLRDFIERDPLTALLNRRSCRRLIDELNVKDTPMIAVMGDIDFFKKINDSYGHAAGDAVLVGVSDIISRSADKYGGFAARWGGEEFLIVYPNASFDSVRGYMEELLNAVRGAVFAHGGENITVTMTFGAAEHLPSETIDETINRADSNLYNGKQSGRNRIVT